MNKDFIHQQKKLLENQLKEFESRLASITIKTDHGEETQFPDLGDAPDENAAEVDQYQNTLALTETLEKEIKDIKEARQRIADGTYGVCKYCGQEIKEERLKIRPTSSSCVDCKKRLSGED